MSTKLFVGNLSFNTTENDLQEAFAAHGTVVEANLMMDRMSGRSRGFAFVTMSTPEEAQKAIAAIKQKPTPAKPKAEIQPLMPPPPPKPPLPPATVQGFLPLPGF